MKTIIDLALLAILAVSVWTGYKKGLISGIAGIVAIIVSLYVGCLLSATFSYEMVPILRPFANGYVDGKMSTVVLEDMNLANTELSLTDILEQDSEMRREFCYETYRAVGMYDDAAEQLAEEAMVYAAENGVNIREAIIEVLCIRMTYVAGVALVFALAYIILIAIGNIPNLSFKIPNMDSLNDVGGAVAGLINGLMLCILLVWLLRFLGILIGPDTLSRTLLGRLCIAIDFITIGIGI